MIFLKSKRLGSIQQLRGPNCNQFSPPTIASSNGQLLTFYILDILRRPLKFGPSFTYNLMILSNVKKKVEDKCDKISLAQVNIKLKYTDNFKPLRFD
jgi:hypothetical protein